MIVVDMSAIVAVLFGEPGGVQLELSRRLGQPLLFVGDDFSKTDVTVP